MRKLRALLGAPPAFAILLALLSMGSGLWPEPAHARAHEAVAKDARLAGDRTRTRFIADLSKKVGINVFSLADPYRVIIDLPEVSFQMPPASAPRGGGSLPVTALGFSRRANRASSST